MRHRKKGKKLGRKSSQRKSLNRILVVNLILNKKIKTTLNKAKITQSLIERLITLSKDKNLASRLKIRSLINNKKAEKELFKELTDKYKERKGGYTRILKLKERKGDNALAVQIEFV